MPVYEYTWLRPDGTEGTDTLEAPSLDAAGSTLRARHIVITGLRELTQEPSDSGKRSFGGVRTNELVMFFTQLSALIKSGVTLVSALKVLEEQTTRRTLRGIIRSVRTDVEHGSGFAAAMRRHPKVFPVVVVSMIEAGEVGSILDLVLERVADSLEARATFRTQMVTALIYPSLVITVAFAAVLILVFVVVPKLEPFILRLGGKLSWNTKLLLSGKTLLADNAAYIIGGLLCLPGSFYALCKTERGRYRIDRMKLKLPIVGPAFLYSNIIQFTRNLASLLESGVPLPTALNTVRDTLHNRAFVELVDRIQDRIVQGDNMSAPLANSDIVPPMLSSMVAVGEETGGMDRSLDMVADIYEKLLQKRMHRMNVLIEPVLTVILFLIVGFIGWSLLSGIWSVYTII
ncbi:MAG TPA: type II secretion system F family protein [Planctomycetota bacterium]|nr:type II secretion system F family protein [Planctomycetota bacterium]